MVHFPDAEDQLIRLAQKAGKNKNIKIERDMLNVIKSGEWEVKVTCKPNWETDTSGNTQNCFIELTHLDKNGILLKPKKLELQLLFPLTEEQKKDVIVNISEMIEKIKYRN
jgi:hypothetical protein